MNLQEQLNRIQEMMGVEKHTKSTNKEFNKYKDSKFHSLREYTFNDMLIIGMNYQISKMIISKQLNILSITQMK
jgi:hypothetical protein